MGGALFVILAAALATYFGLGPYLSIESRAKEGRKAAKGPPAVPVTVATVAKETVAVRLTAIGNVEAYSTVALKARVDGQIVEVNFKEGAPVKRGDVLFRIDPRPYDAALPGDPNQPHPKGRLIFVDNAVDPSTGTIRLRAQFDNEDAALWPGQFVNVSVRLYEESDALLVPSTAVQSGPEGPYVYVVSEEMTAELRRIGVRRTEGERTIVASGLAPGERVVTRGQLRLGPKVRVQITAPGAAPS